MAEKVAREINRVNIFERQWKIKTNQTKFTILPMAQRKMEQIIVDGDHIDYSSSGLQLGLALSTTGIIQHITNKVHKGKDIVASLKRFRGLSTKIKTHLIKAYLIPVLEYPPIPMHLVSKSQMLRLQTILNEALRFAYNERYPYNRNTQELHQQSKLIPLNIRMHKRATNIWKSLEQTDDPIYQKLTEQQNGRPQHSWFPQSLQAINEQPTPLYT